MYKYIYGKPKLRNAMPFLFSMDILERIKMHLFVFIFTCWATGSVQLIKGASCYVLQWNYYKNDKSEYVYVYIYIYIYIYINISVYKYGKLWKELFLTMR